MINDSIRILIVEESSVFRVGLLSLTQGADDLAAIDAVATIGEALDSVSRGIVDVILYGVEGWGPEVESGLLELSAAAPGKPVIILSQENRFGFIQEFLGIGVRGYLPKNVSDMYLLSVVREVSRDERCVFLSVPSGDVRSLSSNLRTPLSRREHEIMSLVARGMTNAQIGNCLAITQGTVKRHLRNIFVKLNAVSRLDAVNKAQTAAPLVPA
ncbi:response regulator transcription factor [Amycolatopsis panacis]|uniref:DNA-binding response regulator n=1 Tax=Amycolatopsis panacis TaxID=2340917 RepID=A0A419I6L5_9PSEU|nr:response regulator transcription factor [Amycolatopsis panacis]RJQ86836.1 DNA-binding response regulator [Amycolatopsis panacis]